MDATTFKAYRVEGTTEDMTDCMCCGRSDLKKTVILVPLDADGGDDGEPVFFGVSCGAKAARWTVKEITQRITAAEKAAAAKRARAEEERRTAEHAAYCAWLTAKFGPKVRQPADLYRMSDVSPYAVLKQYRAEAGL